MNRSALLAALGALLSTASFAAADSVAPLPSVSPAVTLTIHAATPGPRVSPTLYGLMAEEINHSLDGGLYAELISNRSFQDDPDQPVHWSTVQDPGALAKIGLDSNHPLTQILGTSLHLQIVVAADTASAEVANDGYWGIPVQPNTLYKAKFYARCGEGFEGPVSVSLESADGSTVYAQAATGPLVSTWQQYALDLPTGNIVPSSNARFVISANHAGSVWLSLVSLFPPTYADRPNGNRIDLMQKLAAMKPAFLRFPGGNFLEGNTVPERFEWKSTIGPMELRPGHQGPWGYRSTDGMGLLEYLEWCEDLKMHPVLGLFAGYSLSGQYVQPGDDLKPFVQDALDEIEYVTGDDSTQWGYERARDGHLKPFALNYVEIGNEDEFDHSGTYDARFAQFYDAIRAKYPHLKIIATTPVTGRTPDLYDEHYYSSPLILEALAGKYDSYSRTGPKVMVGGWAAQEGDPTPNLDAALADAAWMTGLERNSDVVVMEAYAPLLVNTHPGAARWHPNLIGFDNTRSYGSPTYYAQVMFSANHGDVVLPAAIGGSGDLYQSVTQQTKTGEIFVKIVNTAAHEVNVHIHIDGAPSIHPTGSGVILTSAAPDDTNTIDDPTKVTPKELAVSGLGPDFDYTFAAYSVTILRLQTR